VFVARSEDTHGRPGRVVRQGTPGPSLPADGEYDGSGNLSAQDSQERVLTVVRDGHVFVNLLIQAMDCAEVLRGARSKV
jgi:hypothetical protein